MKGDDEQGQGVGGATEEVDEDSALKATKKKRKKKKKSQQQTDDDAGQDVDAGQEAAADSEPQQPVDAGDSPCNDARGLAAVADGVEIGTNELVDAGGGAVTEEDLDGRGGDEQKPQSNALPTISADSSGASFLDQLERLTSASLLRDDGLMFMEERQQGFAHASQRRPHRSTRLPSRHLRHGRAPEQLGEARELSCPACGPNESNEQ
jgi:hypothetical protein